MQVGARASGRACGLGSPRSNLQRLALNAGWNPAVLGVSLFVIPDARDRYPESSGDTLSSVTPDVRADWRDARVDFALAADLRDAILN